MTITFRPARRSNAKPLIGFYGVSGSGKTHSALLFARGFAGPAGRIVLVDTEAGRGSAYADAIPGGYETAILETTTPADYIAAIDAAEKSGADILVIDSASHEWEGIGGILHMAGEIEARTGKTGLHCWNKPKAEHQRFVLKLLKSPLPIVVCLRAKHKSRQVKDPRSGKTEIVKDDHASPIQADDFIFEMMLHAELFAKPRPDGTPEGGYFRLSKTGADGLAGCFTGEQITIETGAALARWAAGGAASASSAAPPATADDSGPPAGLAVYDQNRRVLATHATAEPWYRALLEAVRSAPDRDTGIQVLQVNKAGTEVFKAEAPAVHERYRPDFEAALSR